MAKKRIDMINLCNKAWDRRVNYSHDEYEDKIKNLLSHAYVKYSEIYEDFCREKGYENDNRIFIAFQRIIVFLMLSDEDFLQGEYDAYVKFCDYCGFEELSVSDCRNIYNQLSVDDLCVEIKILLDLRSLIDPDDYEAMVQGFCYLALAGDKEMDENEYYILKSFFEFGYDSVPSSWEDFKNKW